MLREGGCEGRYVDGARRLLSIHRWRECVDQLRRGGELILV